MLFFIVADDKTSKEKVENMKMKNETNLHARINVCRQDSINRVKIEELQMINLQIHTKTINTMVTANGKPKHNIVIGERKKLETLTI